MAQSSKPKFSILIVEDEIDTMITDIAFVKGIVEQMDHEFVLHHDPDGTGVTTILQNNMIDVIATDKNLIRDELDGIEVISIIRRENPYVDILFYSGQGITEADKEKLKSFSYVQVVDHKEISNELSMLVKKNLAKWDDISYLRGIVISLIIDLERLIHDYIVEFYQISKKDLPSFETHVLQNRYFSFEGKKWFLSQTIVSADFPQLLANLGTLQTARNDLAHSHLHETKKNCLRIKGTDTVIDKNTVSDYYQMGKKVWMQLKQLIELTEYKNFVLKL